jgi:uncharacterized protein (DUF736 family)
MRLLSYLLIIAVIGFFTACSNKEEERMGVIDKSTVSKAIKLMKEKHKNAEDWRIEKGALQVASFWKEVDGSKKEYIQFCVDNFVSDSNALDLAFSRLTKYFESLNGHMTRIALDFSWFIHVDEGEATPVDLMFSGYDVSANISNDFFNNKIAFYTILNFPFFSLDEKNDLGKNWTRKQWAYARIGDYFTSRVPSDLLLKIGEVASKADNYISNYNIFVGFLVDDKGNTFFDKTKKLITHWNLRDEIKAQYANPGGLAGQKMIYEVMNRIITQTIPVNVINSNEYSWNPVANKIFKDGRESDFKAEPNTRYQYLLDNFKARSACDKFNPVYKTYIERQFDRDMEMPQKEVEQLFVKLVSSPTVRKVAALIKQRLGRDLQPFDIWYDGFKARSTISDVELSAITKAKYPDSKAFAADMPNILKKLGFDDVMANRLASLIEVDPSRGAGHAMGAQMKSEKARLRTRIGKDGMDYKGYNIAVHEFGHNVEQTIDLQDIDYYPMNGVPNTAFTEAMAFLFQKRDLDLLGIKNDDPMKEYLLALDNFWASYEIMGVSLVDMNVWKWLYENPNADAEQLKDAVIRISKEIWNKYYAPVFGVKDQPILAIYSHMIDYPLYLSAYPVGHVIELQLDRYMKGKNFATELTRSLLGGRLTPKFWMMNAVGSEVSVQATIDASEEALTFVK